jgi:hypothetical protein
MLLKHDCLSMASPGRFAKQLGRAGSVGLTGQEGGLHDHGASNTYWFQRHIGFG